MEEKINYSSPSQADIAKLSKEAADLLENEVNIYDKSKSYQKVNWCSE